MNTNQKTFGIFVFLSTFARNLIEVFIPLILYKYGYTLKEVLFYYLIVNLTSLILSYPCILISKKFNNKVLTITGIISFVIVQILLNKIFKNIFYLIILAIMFALYRRGYWISRRFYNLKIITKDKISSTYSVISIMNQLGVIFASYIGSLFLDYLGITLLTVISIVLFALSIVPLYLLKFEHEKNNTKIQLINTIKQIPKRDLYLMGTYELLNVIYFLFPLYLFIYVKSSYQTVGIINLITNLAIIIFTYSYGKKIDNKKNYLNLSIILVVLIFIWKANTTSYLLVLISFLEGIFTKMYELSISKEFYTLSKKFEYYNYNLVYEIIQNSFRTLVTILLLLFGTNITIMIYITLIFILIGALFKFKQIRTNNFQKGNTIN